MGKCRNCKNKKELKDALNKIESYLLLDVGRLLYLRLLTAKKILKACLERKIFRCSFYKRRLKEFLDKIFD